MPENRSRLLLTTVLRVVASWNDAPKVLARVDTPYDIGASTHCPWDGRLAPWPECFRAFRKCLHRDLRRYFPFRFTSWKARPRSGGLCVVFTEQAVLSEDFERGRPKRWLRQLAICDCTIERGQCRQFPNPMRSLAAKRPHVRPPSYASASRPKMPDSPISQSQSKRLQWLKIAKMIEGVMWRRTPLVSRPGWHSFDWQILWHDCR